MPVPDATTDAPSAPWCRSAGRPALQPRQRELAALPAVSVMRAAVETDCRHRQVGQCSAGRHRVAEGQRIAARAADVGRGAAVVQRQRRRAARDDRDRLAHGERQR